MYLSIYLLVVEWVNVCGAYCNQPMEICDLNVLSNSNTGNNSVIYHTRWHNNITANHVFFFLYPIHGTGQEQSYQRHFADQNKNKQKQNNIRG